MIDKIFEFLSVTDADYDAMADRPMIHSRGCGMGMGLSSYYWSPEFEQSFPIFQPAAPSKEKKKTSTNQNDVIMRIRNGGEKFNPLSFYKNLRLNEQLSLGDALQHKEFLGLKMVVNMVKHTEYCRTFDVNNLTIVI